MKYFEEPIFCAVSTLRISRNAVVSCELNEFFEESPVYCEQTGYSKYKCIALYWEHIDYFEGTTCFLCVH